MNKFYIVKMQEMTGITDFHTVKMHERSQPFRILCTVKIQLVPYLQKIMPSKQTGKKQDEKPPETSLTDAFAKQGFAVEVQTKVSDGGQKPEESSWLADEEMKAERAKTSNLMKTVKDMQKDGDFKGVSKVGGNYDKYGNNRRNVGGRPPTYKDQSTRNMSRRQRLRHAGPKKAGRREILGALQKEMCERLDKLEEKYPLLRQRKMFWSEAKKIVGDLDRDRVKAMRKNYAQICKKVDRAACGATGAKKRGGNQIEDRLQDSYRSKGIRNSTNGAKWPWKGHEGKIKSWIDKERMRSHTLGIEDVRDEWIDMIDEEIHEFVHSGGHEPSRESLGGAVAEKERFSRK